MISRIIQVLSDKRVASLDVDGSEILEMQRKILDGKPILKNVFNDFYRTCMSIDIDCFSGNGARIEIGAGTSMIKDLFPDVVVTDVRPARHIDRTLDALHMELPAESVRAFYGINCFHHFPDPGLFFEQLERTLTPGGGCVLIEPYYGPLAALLYKRLFTTEKFDKRQAEWTSQSLGAMNGANQALSYVVFIRDALKFHFRYPRIEVVKTIQMTNYMRYILSGGLNFRQLVPNWSERLIKEMEIAAYPARRVFSLHHAIVLRKRC